MNYSIVQKDPFHVLSSTKPVVQHLQHLTIHEDKIDAIASLIAKRIEQGLDMADMHFGQTEDLSDAIQLIFLEDVVNFCFWAEKDRPKWQVEYPAGIISSGGWYGLTKCFQRALAEQIPILDADYIRNLTTKQAQSLFRGIHGTVIPILEKRIENLHEAGNLLKKKYHGIFMNALEEAGFDAIRLVQLLCRDFPSFQDVATWHGKKVYFLKRAQICAQDFSYLQQKYKNMQQIKNIHLLTAFSDYKLPQMLRKFGVISYNKQLANTIDAYVLIPQGSIEEIEIRAATIWSIELIRQRLEKYTASAIDNALWLISQDQSNVLPYHRTYTIFY